MASEYREGIAEASSPVRRLPGVPLPWLVGIRGDVPLFPATLTVVAINWFAARDQAEKLPELRGIDRGQLALVPKIGLAP